jgi:hypothetical protein
MLPRPLDDHSTNHQAQLTFHSQKESHAREAVWLKHEHQAARSEMGVANHTATRRLRQPREVNERSFD